jgi:hypothetical protein
LRAEHSRDYINNAESFAAARAIDLEWDTKSFTSPDHKDQKSWLKVSLGRLHCVEKVICNWEKDYSPNLAWTCSNTNCSTCEGDDCKIYSLTVSSEKAASTGLPLQPDCRYGVSVTMWRINGTGYGVNEIAIIGRKGALINHIPVLLYLAPFVVLFSEITLNRSRLNILKLF